jgi:hypothetical protein
LRKEVYREKKLGSFHGCSNGQRSKRGGGEMGWEGGREGGEGERGGERKGEGGGGGRRERVVTLAI